MCFGNQTTSEKTATSTANPAVAGAATQNLGFVQNLQNQGFTPYSGPQVANFSPQQQQSFDMTGAIAGNGTGQQAQGLINSYTSAPAQNVSSNSIASNMSPYMNQYVMQALAPQLQAMDIQNARTNANTNAQATGSGAFGDARTGIEQGTNNFLQNVQREGVIGGAYNQAFNTAISAGAQDSSNQLTASNANANYAETALGRALGGSQALQGLQNQQLGVAGTVNQMGQQQTAQQQAQLTAQYNNWLMAQQYPFQTAQLLNETTRTGAAAMPASTTTTEQQPNNSGLSLLGSIAGSAIPMMFSDRDLKEDITEIGALRDGTPVYSYRYFDEEMPRIGLMADDVEKRVPSAVIEAWPGGAKMVDYKAATAMARALAMAA